MAEIDPAHHKAKQRFWRRVRAQNTVNDVNQLTNQQIARLAGDAELSSVLCDPQFHDWFLNDKSEEDLIKAGAESAIRALLDIITGVEEVKAPAVKVQAAKILLDMAGFGPKKTTEVLYKDADVGKMSAEDLEKFIADHTGQQ